MNNFSKKGRGNPLKGTKITLRKKVLVLSLLLIAFGSPIEVYSQQKLQKTASTAPQTGITGVVLDNAGIPIIGAIVKVKGSGTGNITDLDGKFTIPGIRLRSVIEISYLGFEKKEVTLEPGVSKNITLESKESYLNEAIVVGYGTQKKISVTGALSTISPTQMLKSPVINASQALVGRVSGITTRQASGQPGNDDVSIRVRGRGTYNDNSALVLVDGVERAFNQLDMNEIETMTILKDAASTAVYGVRGANGVILVTTKQGKEGPAKVSYTANFAINQPTRLPKYANSYDYATLWNEGYKNDNPLKTVDEMPYTLESLQKYKDGSDPVFFPNTDWYKMVMKDYSTQQQHNVNVSGGSKFARYYVSLGFLQQDGLYKNFNAKYGYSNNDNYQRFNLRSNVDVSLTKTTNLNFNIGTRTGIKNRDRSNGGYPTVYDNIPATANLYSPGLHDGKIVVLNGVRAANLILGMSTGFIRYTENNIQSTFGVTQKLDFITKGLSARAKYSYDTKYQYKVERARTPAYYMMKDTIVNGVHDIIYRLSGADESIGGVSSTTYDSRSVREYFEAGINYEKNFGKHAVTGLLLYNQNKSRFDVAAPVGVPVSYLGLVGRSTYNYDSRYLVEFNLGRNGSENFPVNKRFGWFPALSVGWVLSNEAFFSQYISPDVVDYLKIRGSYGVVGNDKGGTRFLYYPSAYGTAGGSLFGEDYKTLGGLTELKLGNPFITWEKAHKQNFGLDMKMFQQKFSLNVDYFYEKRNDILDSRKTIPAMFAAIASTENLGITVNRGIEVELGWNDKIGDVNYFLKSNYSFSRNKVLYTDEAIDVLNPFLARTGRRMEQPFGYQFIGFFKDADDIAQSPSQFSGDSKPGDCKYADINGDGKISEKDQTPIGYPTYPEVGFGLNGGLNYKGFELDFLFQGATNVSLQLSGFMQRPGDSFGQMLASVKQERWTPETSNTATRPRLTVDYANASNYLASTLWMRDASYIRLKNLELAYRFTGKELTKLGISGLRVFVNGQNLLTWDKLKIVDPENGQTSALSYPQLIIYNAGLSLQF